MNIIQRETSVPANGTVDNALSGSAYEFTKGPAIISQGVCAAAAGVQVTIQSGGQSIMEESPALVKTTFPSTQDDFYYNYGAIAGDRLVMRLRNTTGAAIIVRHITQIQPAR